MRRGMFDFYLLVELVVAEGVCQRAGIEQVVEPQVHRGERVGAHVRVVRSILCGDRIDRYITSRSNNITQHLVMKELNIIIFIMCMFLWV